MKPQKRWNKQDIFTWGKHKGESLVKVMTYDVRYVTWCIENVSGFVLDNDTYEAYEAFAETPDLNLHIRERRMYGA